MRDNHFPMAAARPADLKLNNRIQILELFKSGKVMSVAGIAQEIGISRQTVMKAVQFYIEKGIIVSEGKAASGNMGGKRAELFRLSGDFYLFNLLICPDYMYVSLFNFRCEVIDTFLRKDISRLDVDEIVAMAGDACVRMMNEHGIPAGFVRGVCIVVSGIVDQSTDRLRFNSLFPTWGRQVPIAEKLAGFFEPGTLIMMENVAKVCGSAYLQDSRRMNARVATVFSSWGGIAACLMRDGYILHGKDSLIGEIGHMMIAPDDTEICGCGCCGCFERQVSMPRTCRIIEECRRDYPDSVLFDKPIDSITIQNVFDASRGGDALGRMLSARAAGFFAQALRNLTLMFDPARVVFQGDYACADDCFRSTLYQELGAFRYYDEAKGDCSPFSFELDGRSIPDLSTLGAYTLLIDRLFSDQTTYI